MSKRAQNFTQLSIEINKKILAFAFWPPKSVAL
jgi:hypothetical protein